MQSQEFDKNAKTVNGNVVKTSLNSSNDAEEEHMRKELTSYRNEAGQYCCNKCDKHFAYNYNLNQHILRVHEGRSFPCNDCGYKATTKQNLAAHIQSAHEGIKVPCNLCDYKDPPKNLYYHKKKNH